MRNMLLRKSSLLGWWGSLGIGVSVSLILSLYDPDPDSDSDPEPKMSAVGLP